MRNTSTNEFYQRFFETNLGLSCVIDHLGDFKCLNDSWQYEFGYTLEELYAKPFIEFVHPEDRAYTLQEFRRLTEEGEKAGIFESRFRTKKGQYHNVRWLASSDDDVQMIYATCQIISDQKIYQQLSYDLERSEIKLRALFNNTVDAMIVIDEKGVMKEVNEAVTQLFGYTPEELIGKNVKILMPESDKQHHDNYLRNYLKTSQGKIIGVGREVIGLHKAGKPIPFWLTVNKLLINGQDTMFLGVMRDLSDRVRTENQLFETSMMQQAILDSANFSILSTDVDGIIKTFNAGAERMLQYQAEEVIGKMTPEFLHDKNEIVERARKLSDELEKEIQPEFEVFVAKAKLGIPDENEWTYIKKDGTTLPVLLSITALQDKEGRISGFLAIGKDLTEQKKADLMKSEFVSTVSHELRTPLTSIRGSLGLIEAGIVGDLSQKAKDMISIANNNCERLIRLINDILDVSKIESGKMKFSCAMHRIKDIVIRSIQDNQAYAETFQVELKFIDNNINDLVFIDADKIIQVMTNLLSNAIKFSPKNGCVFVELIDSEAHIRIEVRDKGKGIPLAFQPRIFEKFSQADGSDTKEKAGTGLGLNIAKAIVEKHHGEIGFKRGDKEETIFYFLLPKVHTTNTRLQKIKKKNVLICGSDQLYIESLMKLLDQEDCHISVIDSKSEPVNYDIPSDLDLLIYDTSFSKEALLDIHRRCKQSSESDKVPVILVSLDSKENREEMFTPLNIFEVIEKPVNSKKMARVIKEAIAFLNSGSDKPRVLYVEDDYDLFRIVSELVGDFAHVSHADSVQSARKQIAQNKYDLILLDIVLMDGLGTEIIPEIQQIPNKPMVVTFSANELEDDLLNQVDKVMLKSQTSNQDLRSTIFHLLDLR